MNKYELDATNRVKIWNTFLSIAQRSAIELKKEREPNWETSYRHNAELSQEEIFKLQLLTWCILAAESRASHLLHEAVEEHDLSKHKEDEFKNKNLSEEWASLPCAFKRNTQIDLTKKPHSCMKLLCDLRNDLFHVNYDSLKRKLDELSSDQVLNIFVNFIDAMEDMNVKLERGNFKNPRPEVLRIADPFR